MVSSRMRRQGAGKNNAGHVGIPGGHHPGSLDPVLPPLCVRIDEATHDNSRGKPVDADARRVGHPIPRSASPRRARAACALPASAVARSLRSWGTTGFFAVIATSSLPSGRMSLLIIVTAAREPGWFRRRGAGGWGVL